MKKGAERGNRIKTIREHLEKIKKQAHDSEVEAAMIRDYDTASIHAEYVEAIEKVISVCDSFSPFKGEKKETGG